MTAQTNIAISQIIHAQHLSQEDRLALMIYNVTPQTISAILPTPHASSSLRFLKAAVETNNAQGIRFV